MKGLLPLLILTGAFAASVSISPSHVRLPVGSNQSFDIHVVGEGRVGELRVYGTYLDWQSRDIWAGPMGKTVRVVFSPLTEGEYTLTAQFGGASDEATAQVYTQATSDVYERIQGLRSRTEDPAVLAKLDEAEALYNQSRLQLAELKLEEAEAMVTWQPPAADSQLPKFTLAAVVLVVALLAAKFLLG